MRQLYIARFFGLLTIVIIGFGLYGYYVAHYKYIAFTIPASFATFWVGVFVKHDYEYPLRPWTPQQKRRILEKSIASRDAQISWLEQQQAEDRKRLSQLDRSANYRTNGAIDSEYE